MTQLDDIIKKVESTIKQYFYRQEQAFKKSKKRESQRIVCKKESDRVSLYYLIREQQLIIHECSNAICEHTVILEDLKKLKDQIKFQQTK